MSSVATRARNHYRKQQRIGLLGVRAVRQKVRAAKTPDKAKSAAVGTIATYQGLSAISGARTLAAEAGRAPLSVAAAFAGETQLGWPIETAIDTIFDRALKEAQDDLDRAVDIAFASLDLLAQSEIIASGTDAASVEIAMEPDWTNYVRVLALPSCKRCVILAGRIYRDKEAFPRHPKCDCQHWPVESWDEAERQGLVTDPQVAFERDQIGGYRTLKDGSTRYERGLSAADWKAVEDGADLQEVANATRGGGRRPEGMTDAITEEIFGRTVKATAAGTTKRAAWRRKHPNLPIRLRPQSIYAHAKDEADAIRLLRLYGYIK